jgi:CRP/FNR family cyclic AMP-dependent transcriptional regulator
METPPEPMATRVALHPFLAGMNRTQLALLTDCAMATHFKLDQIIFREGEPANRFYLIETGKVVLESGKGFDKPVVVETIGAGDLLGWSWMFPPYVWHFTARAVEPTEAIFFYGTILQGNRFDPLPLLTHRFKLDQIIEAYDAFGSRRDGCLKVAIKP